MQQRRLPNTNTIVEIVPDSYVIAASNYRVR